MMGDPDRKLGASEGHLRAVEESARDAILAADDQGTILTWNHAAMITFQYEAGETLGRSLEILVPERERGRLRRRLRAKFIDDDSPPPSEIREVVARRKDGHEFPADLVLTRWLKDGAPYLTVIVRDLSERRDAELALRKQVDLYQALLDAQSDLGMGVVITRADAASFLYTNDAFCRMCGYTHDELTALKSQSILVPPDTRTLASDRITPRTLAERLNEHYETVLVHKDGSRIDVEVSWKMIEGGAKRVAILRDITERKRTRERLLLADRLTSVGTLAAGIAHEINNPLSYVLTNLEVIETDLTDVLKTTKTEHGARLQEVLGATQEAREGADRVRKIVRDIKTLSRQDDGETTTAVAVHGVMDLAINMVWNEIRHRARLVKDFRDVPLVEANETRLGQVFVNLLVNAAQAIPDGHADRNEIRIVTYTDSLERACIEIHDTGIGIPSDVRNRIFDPFFTTKPVGIGTGLGLSVCMGIVSTLGGELTVESEPGRGTMFRVVLPRASERSVEPAPLVASIVPARRRGKILVIDDEPAVGTAIRRTLSNEHDVEVTTVPREAVARVATGERFDAILCDVMMPEMTGIEVLSELQRIAPVQADKLIFITGGVFTSSAKLSLDAVPNPRFEKPIDTRMLRALLRERVREE